MKLNDKAIRAAAVVARHLPSLDSVLVAYLVGRSGKRPTLPRSRARLQTVLPPHA